MEATFPVELQLLHGVKPTLISKNFFPFCYSGQKFRVGNCLETAVPALLLELQLGLTSVHAIHEEAASVALRWDGLGWDQAPGRAWSCQPATGAPHI